MRDLTGKPYQKWTKEDEGDEVGVCQSRPALFVFNDDSVLVKFQSARIARPPANARQHDVGPGFSRGTSSHCSNNNKELIHVHVLSWVDRLTDNGQSDIKSSQKLNGTGLHWKQIKLERREKEYLKRARFASCQYQNNLPSINTWRNKDPIA